MPYSPEAKRMVAAAEEQRRAATQAFCKEKQRAAIRASCARRKAEQLAAGVAPVKRKLVLVREAPRFAVNPFALEYLTAHHCVDAFTRWPVHPVFERYAPGREAELVTVEEARSNWFTYSVFRLAGPEEALHLQRGTPIGHLMFTELLALALNGQMSVASVRYVRRLHLHVASIGRAPTSTPTSPSLEA
jgi:hypothetical protein